MAGICPMCQNNGGKWTELDADVHSIGLGYLDVRTCPRCGFVAKFVKKPRQTDPLMKGVQANEW